MRNRNTTSETKTYYSKSKNLLSSLYGTMAQDPVKQSILFEEGTDCLFRLQEGLRMAYGEHGWPIYCDTDSVKDIGSVSHKTTRIF